MGNEQAGGQRAGARRGGRGRGRVRRAGRGGGGRRPVVVLPHEDADSEWDTSSVSDSDHEFSGMRQLERESVDSHLASGKRGIDDLPEVTHSFESEYIGDALPHGFALRSGGAPHCRVPPRSIMFVAGEGTKYLHEFDEKFGRTKKRVRCPLTERLFYVALRPFATEKQKVLLFVNVSQNTLFTYNPHTGDSDYFPLVDIKLTKSGHGPDMDSKKSSSFIEDRNRLVEASHEHARTHGSGRMRTQRRSEERTADRRRDGGGDDAHDEDDEVPLFGFGAQCAIGGKDRNLLVVTGGSIHNFGVSILNLWTLEWVLRDTSALPRVLRQRYLPRQLMLAHSVTQQWVYHCMFPLRCEEDCGRIYPRKQRPTARQCQLEADGSAKIRRFRPTVLKSADSSSSVQCTATGKSEDAPMTEATESSSSTDEKSSVRRQHCEEFDDSDDHYYLDQFASSFLILNQSDCFCAAFLLRILYEKQSVVPPSPPTMGGLMADDISSSALPKAETRTPTNHKYEVNTNVIRGVRVTAVEWNFGRHIVTDCVVVPSALPMAGSLLSTERTMAAASSRLPTDCSSTISRSSAAVASEMEVDDEIITKQTTDTSLPTPIMSPGIFDWSTSSSVDSSPRGAALVIKKRKSEKRVRKCAAQRRRYRNFLVVFGAKKHNRMFEDSATRTMPRMGEFQGSVEAFVDDDSETEGSSAEIESQKSDDSIFEEKSGVEIKQSAAAETCSSSKKLKKARKKRTERSKKVNALTRKVWVCDLASLFDSLKKQKLERQRQQTQLQLIKERSRIEDEESTEAAAATAAADGGGEDFEGDDDFDRDDLVVRRLLKRRRRLAQSEAVTHSPDSRRTMTVESSSRGVDDGGDESDGDSEDESGDDDDRGVDENASELPQERAKLVLEMKVWTASHLRAFDRNFGRTCVLSNDGAAVHLFGGEKATGNHSLLQMSSAQQRVLETAVAEGCAQNRIQLPIEISKMIVHFVTDVSLCLGLY